MLPDELIIEPNSGFKHYWQDIWRYRELFYILAWRDILVRYKQTVIGIAWALIRPFVTMIVFTIVFNKVAKLEAPGSVPYPLLVFAAMLPWQFFSTALSESSNSLVSNANLISKVYFPRHDRSGRVGHHQLRGFSDHLRADGGDDALVRLSARLADRDLPLFVALAFGSAFGAGLWLCALNVKYRDFRYVIPFIVQFGLYVSPVGFSSDNIPENWRLLYSLNPMVGVIDGFRWALLRGEVALWWPGVLTSVALTSGLCLFGIWYFRRTEDGFADVI